MPESVRAECLDQRDDKEADGGVHDQWELIEQSHEAVVAIVLGDDEVSDEDNRHVEHDVHDEGEEVADNTDDVALMAPLWGRPLGVGRGEATGSTAVDPVRGSRISLMFAWKEWDGLHTGLNNSFY